MERARSAAVQAMIDRRQGEATKKSYGYAVSRICRWLAARDPSLFTPSDDESGAADPSRLRLDVVPVNTLAEFFIERIQRVDADGNPNPVGRSTLSVERSALRALYAQRHLPLPANFDSELALVFAGLKRVDAANRRESSVRISDQEGKEPLPFGVYRATARSLLLSGHQDALWAHCFSVLCWNLISRAVNVAALRMARIKWLSDALGAFFAFTKTDQGGERPKHAFHLYANPFTPEICPVLALALRLMSFGLNANGALFEGNQQQSRFGETLKRHLSSPALAPELEAAGLKVSDLGSHSFRKGAATFALSGSTVGPSIMSVSLRAGWKTGIVQERYIRYEGASDQYLGRILSGLHLHSLDFAALPPRFSSAAGVQGEIRGAVNACFPDTVSGHLHLFPVLSHCLASVVHHSEWLLRHLAPLSPLRSLPPLCDPALLTSLRAKMVEGDADGLRATGLPPHIVYLKENAEIKQLLRTILSEVENVSDKTVAGIEEVLERRCVESGNVTPQSLRELVSAAVRDALPASGGGWQTAAQAPAAGAVQPPPQETPLHGHWWDGRLRQLPEDFALPRTSVENGWILWCVGDAERQIPPFRVLNAQFDFASAAERKRFSEWRSLYTRLENSLARKHLLVRNPSFEDARVMFAYCSSLLARMAPTSPRSRQLHVTTMVKRMRANLPRLDELVNASMLAGVASDAN